MGTIGIDFGSDSCVVSYLRSNKAAIVVNDYYERKTP
jgi:molecular chaperone DnaK (HSP70)